MIKISLDFQLVDYGKSTGMKIELFSANITHNLVPMWRKSGIYDALYNSEGKHAVGVIKSLNAGMLDMKMRDTEYKLLDAPNGWGVYRDAIYFLRRVINACEANPHAFIKIDR